MNSADTAFAQALGKEAHHLVPPVFIKSKIRPSMAHQVSVKCNQLKSGNGTGRLPLKPSQLSIDGIKINQFFRLNECEQVGEFISPDLVKGIFFSRSNGYRKNASARRDESKNLCEYFVFPKCCGQYPSTAQDGKESKSSINFFVEVFGQSMKRDGIGNVQSCFVCSPFILSGFHVRSPFVLDSEVADSAQAEHYFLLAFPWERSLQKDWWSLDSRSGSIERALPPLFFAPEARDVKAW